MELLNAEDPRWIGRYRLLGRLGEGGMGRVYLARSDRGRTVAVKVVQAELAQQADFRRRFALEISAARRVGAPATEGGAGGAEWTAPVLDADTEAATPWVATGYVAGPSLSEVVGTQHGPLPRHSVLALAAGLVQALGAVHGAGLVHRDLKPSNVLVTIDGPRVIDFGIARALDTAVQSGGGLTRTGGLVGSPGFMSPEQVRGQPVTTASDVFCLGAVLAYAATGRMPFGTADSGIHALLFRIAEEEPELSGIDGDLRELVADCLTKAPEQRPTLDDLAERTRGALDSRAWLPGEVLAELGRHAVQLLDSEDPASEQQGQQPGFGPAAGPAGPPPGPGPATGAAGPSTPRPSFGSPAGAYGPPTPAPYQGPYPGGRPVGYPETPPPGMPVPGGTPPPGGRTPPAPARTARRIAQPLQILLGLFLVWLTIHLIVDVLAIGKLDEAESRNTATPVSAVDGIGGLTTASQTLRGLGWPLFLVVVAVWLLWFWRMRTNAEAFLPNRVRYPSGMSVFAWFIPVCNFFMPKQIANDIWTATAPEGALWTNRYNRPRLPKPLLTSWWTLWLIFFCFGFIAFWQNWYEAVGVDTAVGYAGLSLLMDIPGIPAVILAASMVRRLTTMQDNRVAAAHR